ncbi:MAG: Fibronectin type domain protein [Bacteroidetes bacterium]|nr:Fibronectin type domain protein [Bacteroidota bacterium]
MNKLMKITTQCFFLLATPVLLLMMSDRAQAQGQTKWIQVGSLHNWYSEKGGEIEEGNVLEQQYGLRWPALVNRTDAQAAKGFWIGASNFTDAQGITWTPKVIAVGPRWKGDNEFFPKTFDAYAQFDPPRVLVDGNPSFANPEEIKAVSDTIKSDRLIINRVTTILGITVERKIYAFSQQYHDNYHIMDYTFTNTGNPDIGLTAKTLTGVMFYWQFRYAPGGPGPGYEVSNSARWGMNSMNDARGYPADIKNSLIPASENDVRCMFTWLGLHTAANRPTAGSSPNAATFDNIGAPIFSSTGITGVSTFIQAADTNWRLGAAQFAGNGAIYADKSATDRTDDPNEPSTTSFLGSDEPITQNNANTQFNTAAIAGEYAKMTEGHAPRHAWLVDPAGKFSEQTIMGNIGVGAPGGWSHGMGYGPYTLAPGQSVRIVWAEGVSGLTFDECVSVGLQYKRGTITTKMKNDSVLSGRLRLLETMRRAVANFKSGFNIPKPPYPPATFNVRGGGDRIALSWDPNPKESANGFQGYRIYRATGRADSAYRLIYQCGGTKPSDPNVKYDASKTYAFNDITATRGISYYYYITSLGSPIAADASTRTPAGALESNMFYTRTYDPAFLKRPAGTSSSQIRIAPNPYVITSSENTLRFPSEPDKIAFFNIPGNCLISIYTELGELIKQIDHTDGTGDAYWNSITSSNQVIVSGIYIVVIENKDNGEKTMKKLVVVR